MDGIGLSMGWVGSATDSIELGERKMDPRLTEHLGQAQQSGSSFEWVGASRVISSLNSQAQQHFKTQNNFLKKKSKTIFLKKSQKNLLKIQTKNPRSMRLKQNQNPEQS